LVAQATSDTGSLLDSNLMPVTLLAVQVLAVMDGTKLEEA
jgi:hypothetical protein